jgi:outer membrane protein assembly factor BamB
MSRRIAVALLLCHSAFSLQPSAFGADWPQWRGPARDGKTPEAVAPWGKDGLKTLWKAPFGEGHSSPVVAGGKVFVLSKDKDDEVVTALDAATGKQLWRKAYRAPFNNQFGNGPRATPLADGKRVYTLGATGILTAWDAETGAEVWKADTFKQFNATNLFFGVSSSPVLDGERLIVEVGGQPGASVVALDRADGKVLWKAGDDRSSYASPALLGTGPDREAVCVCFREVLSLNPETGAVRWSFPLKTKHDENAVTPVSAAGLTVISSLDTGLRGLRTVARDAKTAAEVVWVNKDINCYFSTPVAHGDTLFAVHGGTYLISKAKLSAIDAKTGKELWTKPEIGDLHGSLILTGNDKLLLLTDRGILLLLEPSAEGYKELASAKVCGTTWVHPAVADGRIYVKDGEGLRCLELPKP